MMVYIKLFSFITLFLINNSLFALTGLDLKSSSVLKGKFLYIKDFPANVVIKDHMSGDVIIEMSGPDDQLEKINIEENNNTITINSNKEWSLQVLKEEPKVNINISLPKNTYINAELIGKSLWNVDEITVPVNITLKDESEMKARGFLGKSELRLLGRSKLTVGNIQRYCEVTLLGSSEAIFNKGSADIVANINGAGTLRFLGKSKKSNLSVIGSGEIEISVLEKESTAQILGSGNITVNSASLDSFSGTIKGIGRIYIGGKTKVGNFDINGLGEIEIGSVSDKIQHEQIIGRGQLIIQDRL